MLHKILTELIELYINLSLKCRMMSIFCNDSSISILYPNVSLFNMTQGF